MRKTLAAVGLAVAALTLSASTAVAAPQPDDDSLLGRIVGDGGIGNNLCVAPWMWNGPLNIDSDAEGYMACNYAESASGGILNNVCLLPWNWNGPLNVGSDSKYYTACNYGPAHRTQ
ncbi:hypothetical protein AB0M28_18025 [Streptomyces sp. NPDC051940]|uniref:hypothetical protein n=1 Tax=Streptomyces sp. NPDC051940 TaxID=3155675 RepID=UPI00343605A5